MATKEKRIQPPENELFEQYRKTRDPALRNALINRYIYIAEILAKRFSGKGIDYDDLFQVACLGLLYAVERFDPGMGVKFNTFATPTVSGEIKRYFRDKGNFIRVPRRLYEIFAKADRIRRANGGEEAPARTAVLPSVISLDQELMNTEDMRLEHTLGSDDDGFLMVEDKDFVEDCMRQLSEDENEFIRRRYYQEQTQKQIAGHMGISQMCVSRMERRVLEKIKKMYFKSVQ